MEFIMVNTKLEICPVFVFLQQEKLDIGHSMLYKYRVTKKGESYEEDTSKSVGISCPIGNCPSSRST